MSYALEVEMIGAARELDLLTCPYVFTLEDARAMAAAGADVLVPHMGLTTGGAIGAETARGRSTSASSSSRRCTMRPSRSRRTSSSSATGGRSPSRTTAARPSLHLRCRRLLRRPRHGAARPRSR